MNPYSALRSTSAALSDVGAVRVRNEDAFLELELCQRGGLWVVADGMGGHHAGDLASRLVVDALASVASPENLSDFIDDVQGRLEGVNAQLLGLCDSEGLLSGSTVVALLAFKHQSACIWAGDSRVYLLRDRSLTRLTRDHSEVQDLIDAGRIDSGVEIGSGNVLTRAIGATDELELEVKFQALRGNDRYLLCSDGLYNAVSEDEIGALLEGGSAEESCSSLVRRAIELQCSDNVTALVVDFRVVE